MTRAAYCAPRDRTTGDRPPRDFVAILPPPEMYSTKAFREPIHTERPCVHVFALALSTYSLLLLTDLSKFNKCCVDEWNRTIV